MEDSSTLMAFVIAENVYLDLCVNDVNEINERKWC
jgi:hypothetical protein